MSYLDELAEVAPGLPLVVWEDIKSRVGDWMLGGGSGNDPYIQQQVRYAKHVIAALNNKDI